MNTLPPLTSPPNAVLFYSHDWSYAFTKTTESLAISCERLDIPAIVRDSCDARASRLVTETIEQEKTSLTPSVTASMASRLDHLIEDFGIDCIISLDLGWLFLPDFFLDHPRIHRIYSLWFDDFLSWCGAPNNAIFPLQKRSFQQILRHPKLCHCFYGQALAREAQRLGFPNQTMSPLAAPKEFLTQNHPILVKDKLGFIGNPGSRQPPSKDIIKRLTADAPLSELRELSCYELKAAIQTGKTWPWIEEIHGLKDLLLTSFKFKSENPFISALEILEACGSHFPETLHLLNESGHILEAAHLIKMVTRYDRPAFVSYLHRKGLCEVISNPHEWAPYQVSSLPSVFADELPATYMRYPAHVNAPNPIRDATANEKLFEIAACGRASLNLDSPDVRSCYSENEIYLANTLQESADIASDILKNPEAALHKGKHARLATARSHTWDHRLTHLFNSILPQKNTHTP